MIWYFAVYAIIGRICVFFLQKFPFHKLFFVGKWWKEGGFLHDLFACDLCLGVWCYSILSVVFPMNILCGLFYVPVISELITGAVTSLIAFLVVKGFQAQFGVIEVN